MTYNEKELGVLEAVLELLKAGADLAGLKVADIAEKANMGKGTIYEYFSSKEEILSKAREYGLYQWNSNMEGKMAEEYSFMGKLEAVFTSIIQESSSWRVLLRAGNMGICETDFSRDKVAEGLRAIVDRLLSVAFGEGAVRAELDRAYAYSALIYIIGGFCMMCVFDYGMQEPALAKAHAVQLTCATLC